MKVLLFTPPMTQLNTPYPASCYLVGFLKKHASSWCQPLQADPSIELAHRIFSRQGIEDLAQIISELDAREYRQANVQWFVDRLPRYLNAIEPVMSFLQGKDSTLSYRIEQRRYLPEGPRFGVIEQFDQQIEDSLYESFGQIGIFDRAKYLATLFLDDIADVFRIVVDERFKLSCYAEKLSASAPSFDLIHNAVQNDYSLIDSYIDKITDDLLAEHEPDVIGMSAPFPGNVYGAFRMAKRIREVSASTKLILGGGFVNTELRELSDPRIFEYFDYLPFDDGESPLLSILEVIRGTHPPDHLLRTKVLQHGVVKWMSHPELHDIPFKDSGTPTYQGLNLERYLSLIEVPNPMHRMWSDGRWNKLTLAHGCYWKGCSFCDITLDYIERYEDLSANLIIDRIEALVAETGSRGFHFVDEAAPPKTLFAMSRRLLEREVEVSWWGNIRFEKSFTSKRVDLMAEAGCVAISGGLEVASDRLLKLMNKGVTVPQVARVCRAFSDAGILVHAYLMYGFPTQTLQDTVDALEMVRQLFMHGCIQSAYWHRFTATVHSPVGQQPQKFGVKVVNVQPSTFARNDLEIEDPTGVDHDSLSAPLHKAVYNYMHGIGLEEGLDFWFDDQVPATTVDKDFITKALAAKTP